VTQGDWDFPFDPPPEYTTLRALGPLTRVPCPAGLTAWLVTTCAGAREVLARFPTAPPTTAPGDRRPAGRFLTLPHPYRLTDLDPVIRRVTARAVAELPVTRRPGDVHLPLSRRIATEVMTALLGGPTLPQRVADFITARRSAAGDDLLSRLMIHGHPGDELVAMNVALLTATVEAGAGLLTDAVVTLSSTPEQWRRVRADPGLAPAAAEALMRHLGASSPCCN